MFTALVDDKAKFFSVQPSLLHGETQIAVAVI